MTYDVWNNLYANSGLMKLGGHGLSDAMEYVQAREIDLLQDSKLLA